MPSAKSSARDDVTTGLRIRPLLADLGKLLNLLDDECPECPTMHHPLADDFADGLSVLYEQKEFSYFLTACARLSHTISGVFPKA